MTDLTNIPEIDSALNEVLPELAKERWITAGSLLALTVVAGLLIYWGLTTDHQRVAIIVTIGGLALFLQLLHWLKRGHERKVLPILARTINLEFQKDPTLRRDQFPRSFLPSRGREVWEDHVSGTFGDKRIGAAELQVETGGKHSVTLFRGMVIWASASGPELSLTIAPIDKTKSGLLSAPALDVEGQHYLGDISSRSGLLGVWGRQGQSVQPDMVHAYASALIRAANAMPAECTVFSAARSEKYGYVALSYKRTKFAFGGIFASRTKMQDQIALAFADLNAVLAVGAAIIAAEAELSPAPEATLSPNSL